MRILVLAVAIAGIFATDSAPFRVLGVDAATKEVIVQPYVAPLFGFRVVDGRAPDLGPVNCHQSEEKHRDGPNESDPIHTFIYLNCDGGLKMRLVEVDLSH